VNSYATDLEKNIFLSTNTSRRTTSLPLVLHEGKQCKKAALLKRFSSVGTFHM